MPTLQQAKTRRYSRFTYGDDGDRGRRNILSVSFVATDLLRPAVANANILLAATGVSNTSSTTLPVAPNPDIPRNIVITVGGTAASVSAGNITVTGTNSEGATITENFATTAGATGAIVGNKAFRTINSVVVPQQGGAGVTVAVGYGGKLGICLRNMPNMPIKVLLRSATGVETLEDPSAFSLNATDVSLNTVTTATANDGIRAFRVYVHNYNWHINPVNSQPNYGV